VFCPNGPTYYHQRREMPALASVNPNHLLLFGGIPHYAPLSEEGVCARHYSPTAVEDQFHQRLIQPSAKELESVAGCLRQRLRGQPMS
jgi:hypothetical protein